MIIYKGNIVYSISKDELKEFEQGYILVDDEGKVVDVLSSLPKEYKDIKVIDYKDIIGFEDTLELKNKFYSLKCISSYGELDKIHLVDFIRIIQKKLSVSLTI